MHIHYIQSFSVSLSQSYIQYHTNLDRWHILLKVCPLQLKQEEKTIIWTSFKKLLWIDLYKKIKIKFLVFAGVNVWGDRAFFQMSSVKLRRLYRNRVGLNCFWVVSYNRENKHGNRSMELEEVGEDREGTEKHHVRLHLQARNAKKCQRLQEVERAQEGS